MKLIENSARCRNCGDKIISRHRHEMVSCTCYKKWSEFVDSDILTVEQKKIVLSWARGIFVDGGTAYQRAGFFRIEDFEDTAVYEEE